MGDKTAKSTGCSTDVAGKIIIGGCGFTPDSRPDDFSIFPGDEHIKNVVVTNFMDPGGFTFYESTSPEFTSKGGDLVHARKSRSGSGRIGGQGWSMDELKESLRLIVIHHDGSLDSAGCYRTLLDRGYSSHFMINWDGHVYQAADVADVTLHGNETNGVSIGIDMNNIATVIAPGSSPEIPQGRQVSEPLNINGQDFVSLTYKPAQYRSLVAVLRVVRAAMEIEQDFPVDEKGEILTTVMKEPPPKAYSGIIFHWHIKEDKWDPGPGFDWKRVRAALQRESAAMPALPANFGEVCPPAGPLAELRSVPYEELPSKAGEAFASEDLARIFGRTVNRAIELWKADPGAEGGGGYYPMGINQTWHNGIHIPLRPGAPIHPILAGEVVAAHLVPENGPPGDPASFPSLGSNNFVLLRHRIELPPRGVKPEAEGEEQVVEKNLLTVYSLYMHLAGVDLRKPPRELDEFCSLLKGSGEFKYPASRPTGPMLESLPAIEDRSTQYGAMLQGYVGLFSPKDKMSVKVGPRTVIGFAGQFGEPREHVLHVEVFADDRCLSAMELALYGDYLQLGVDEPERDLLVRSQFILSLFGEPPEDAKRARLGLGRTLSDEMIKEWLKSEASEAEETGREVLRRMIVRHVSEWSDQVDWVQALLKTRGEEDWWQRNNERFVKGAGLFTNEIKEFLRYTWLDDKVAKHIGLEWSKHPGVLYFFNPVNFVLWWMFRRSAVRGEGVDAILAELGGTQKASITKEVSESVKEYFLKQSDGQGEWEM